MVTKNVSDITAFIYLIGFAASKNPSEKHMIKVNDKNTGLIDI